MVAAIQNAKWLARLCWSLSSFVVVVTVGVVGLWGDLEKARAEHALAKQKINKRTDGDSSLGSDVMRYA